MDGAARVPEQRLLAPPDDAATLRFSVLGPVRAWWGPHSLTMGSPQQRGLLAALLLREGRTATAAELIDALWGEEPPSQALAAVRTYASRLRKVLPPGVLVSESGGYAIRSLPDGALDLAVAQERAAQAERARTAGDPRRASELLDEALALWDGEPLAGVPGPYADGQRVRLEEWRLQLLESRLDLELEQGNYAQAVAELTALTAAHPLRETLRELLMLALYRSGRQAEALAVYADTQRLLADELGLDPRPSLVELQRRILQADPGLAGHPAPRPPRQEEPAPVPVRPAQLPATVPDFTGRASLVSELGEVLASVGDRAMAVCAVTGVGGVGKTTLAVHVARQARNAFPDGHLYVDLQGTGPRAARPETVLGSFLRALGAADSALPDSLEERSALYRSVLDGRRVLVVLDNAKDAAQVRPLLPGMEGCAALVTSRTRMADLPGAHLVDLDVMAPDEALTLFTRIVGEERVAGEREAALDVVAACGFLPLAVRIAASRLAARRTWTVSALAARLADERDRLDQLGVGELAVTAAFDATYRALEPAQARAFRLLGVPDGPDISLPAAAAVLDRPVARTEDLLESLVDMSLLESVAPGRYRYHDLVRLYARACAERDERPPTEIKAARERLLDFHLDTAVGVYAGERPGDRLVDHLEPTHGGGLHFTGRAQGLDWLFGEAGALLAAAHQAATAGQVRKGVDLLLLTRDLAASGRHVQRYESVARALLGAAVAAGDTRAEARARALRARLHCLAGRFADAEPEAREAVRLAASAGDTWTLADGLTVKGLAALERHWHQVAEQDLARAVECFRSLGDRPGEARALSRLSRVHLATEATPTAVVLARRAVALYDATGASVHGGHARHALALALARSGEPDSAARRLHEAVERFRAGRQLVSEAQALCALADIAFDARRPAEAAAHAEQALSVLRGLEAEWHRAHALTVLGRALARLGRRDAADAAWREAVDLYDRLRSPEAETVRALLDGPSRDRCGAEA